MVGCITDLMDMRLSMLWELVLDWEAWPAAVHAVTKSWTQLSDFTSLLLLASHETMEKYFTLSEPVLSIA